LLKHGPVFSLVSEDAEFCELASLTGFRKGHLLTGLTCARRQLLEAGDAEIHLKLGISDVRRRVEVLSYRMEPAYLVVSDLMVSEACELFARMGRKVIESNLGLRKSLIQIQLANISALASATALERTAEAAFWWTL
jgi:hypothetical protein